MFVDNRRPRLTVTRWFYGVSPLSLSLTLRLHYYIIYCPRAHGATSACVAATTVNATRPNTVGRTRHTRPGAGRPGGSRPGCLEIIRNIYFFLEREKKKTTLPTGSLKLNLHHVLRRDPSIVRPAQLDKPSRYRHVCPVSDVQSYRVRLLGFIRILGS